MLSDLVSLHLKRNLLLNNEYRLCKETKDSMKRQPFHAASLDRKRKDLTLMSSCLSNKQNKQDPIIGENK